MKPPSTECSFDLTEHGLNRIELWTICNIEDGFYVQLRVEELHIFVLVGLHTIHEQGQGYVIEFLTEILQELNERWSFYRRVVDHVKLHAPLFGHCRDDGSIPCINIGLVHGEIGILGAPLLALEGELGEINLVEIDNHSALELSLIDFIQTYFGSELEVISNFAGEMLLLSHLLHSDSIL